MANPPRSNNSIQIGGDVSGTMIVSGNNNVVSNQSTTAPASTSATEPNTEPRRRKLLLLASNPKNSVRQRLDEEIRDISEGLKRSQHRDEFEIAQKWAVRSRDLQRAMQEELPQIVHFTGQADNGLCLEDATGKEKPVTASALAGLFKLFAQKVAIECVVLNRCYDPAQAAAITQSVPCVIGVNKALSDQAAIEFVVGFYDALGSGESMTFAFESGKVALALSGEESGEDDSIMPVLLAHS